MSNQDIIKALVKRMSGQANIIAIPRIYLDLLGNDHACAFFLSQSVYWSDKGAADGGWFWKSAKEWHAEAGLSTYQVTRAAKVCEKWVEVKLKKAMGAPTLHYRVNMDALTVSILEFLENPLSRKSSNSKIDLQETPKSLTETTPEIKEEEEEEATPPKAQQPKTKTPIREYLKAYEQNVGYPGAPGSVIYEGICEWAGKVTLAYWLECVACYAKNNGHTFTFLERILIDGPRTVTKAPAARTTTPARPSAPRNTAPAAQVIDNAPAEQPAPAKVSKFASMFTHLPSQQGAD